MNKSFDTMKLKLNGFKAILQETIIDTFSENTLDKRQVTLRITDKGNCLFQFGYIHGIIGWTNNKEFALYYLRNVVSLLNAKELYYSHKLNVKKILEVKND